MTLLRVSTPESEGIYQGSRWLKFQVLCEMEELQNLFQRLLPFFIFPLTGIRGGDPFPQERFLAEYRSWIEGLKKGSVPEDQALRKILAAVFTDDLDALWLQEVPGKGYLTKLRKPLLQVQAHWCTYSETHAVFHPMSMGLHSIFWGLQFSYPGVYQDPKTMEIKQVKSTRLFENLRLWVREMTRVTPFLVKGRRINASIRLGKQTFSWIEHHPQLLAQGIQVYGR